MDEKKKLMMDRQIQTEHLYVVITDQLNRTIHPSVQDNPHKCILHEMRSPVCLISGQGEENRQPDGKRSLETQLPSKQYE